MRNISVKLISILPVVLRYFLSRDLVPILVTRIIEVILAEGIMRNISMKLF